MSLSAATWDWSVDAPPHPIDKEARALWHLELLGCHEPDEAVAPYIPQTEQYRWSDDLDDGEYLGMVTCWACGGLGVEIRCCDDLCHGQDWCMHGDNFHCRECDGHGFM